MSPQTKAVAEEEVAGKKPAAKPSAAKKKKGTGVKALKKDKGRKADEGKLNPPKWKDFQGQKLAGVDMAMLRGDNKDMKNTDFTGVDLSGANFQGFNLQGSIFRNSNLEDTDFRGADLRWSDMRGANVDDAIFYDEDDVGQPVNAANVNEVRGLES